jgi:histidyl-tRNA synthetase
VSDGEEDARRRMHLRWGYAEPDVTVFVVPLGDGDLVKGAARGVAEELAMLGVTARVKERNLKGAIRDAAATSAFYVVVVGNDELASGTLSLRDLDAKTNEVLPLGDALARLARECRPWR